MAHYQWYPRKVISKLYLKCAINVTRNKHGVASPSATAPGFLQLQTTTKLLMEINTSEVVKKIWDIIQVKRENCKWSSLLYPRIMEVQSNSKIKNILNQRGVNVKMVNWTESGM